LYDARSRPNATKAGELLQGVCTARKPQMNTDKLG